MGEQVKAIVQLLPGMEGSDNLAEELAASILHEVARSQTGKLMKQELRSRYWSEKAA